MRIFLMALLALILTTPSVFSQIPFEKDGKWGIKDESTNKVLIKPQFISLRITEFPQVFIASKNINKQYIKDRPLFGMVDQKGSIIVPFKADSITFYNDIIISHNSEYKLVNDTKAKAFPYTEFYNFEGNLLGKVNGLINPFKGGFVVADFEKKPVVESLYNWNFDKISNSMKLINIYDHFILTKENNTYRLYDILNLTPLLNFSDYYKYQTDFLIIKETGQYGYINTQSDEYCGPIFTKAQNVNLGSHYELVLSNNEDMFSINNNGEIHKVKLTRNGNGDNIIVYIDSDGNNNLKGFECENFIPYKDGRSYFNVQKNGLWGVYDTEEKEITVPLIFPRPIEKWIGQEYVILTTDEGAELYDFGGNLLFATEEGKIDDVHRNIVFIDAHYSPSGIYSLNKNKWIIPYKKYDYINPLNYSIMAVSNYDSNTYFIYNYDGVLLNTLNGVKDISSVLGDVIHVKGTNNKMGLLNKNNGQWLVRCLYEDDIAWGSGTGENQRFAVTQKKDKGEEVIVMTVGGKKIASQFFPYGTKPIVIKNFGKKYLYQSF